MYQDIRFLLNVVRLHALRPTMTLLPICLLMSTFFSCTQELAKEDLGYQGTADIGMEDREEDMTPNMVIDPECDPLVSPCTVCESSQCNDPACRDAEICQPCEEGGNCLFSGNLRIFGNIKSDSGNVIGDMSVLATCGEKEVEENPDENGDYSLSIQVENCEQLTVTVQRAAQTEGYVPLVYRYRMPPPVNAIELNLKVKEAKEIRCDGVFCEARNVFKGLDYGHYRTGYAYNSVELNDISNFGAIFESNDQELLWLHRFIYRDYRNERSETLNNFALNIGEEVVYIGLARLNFETRAWVNDLSTLGKAFDYHRKEYSIYVDQDSAWERNEQALTDPNIDPDQDQFYDTIDMATYKLNINTGKWELLKSAQDELLFSNIWAVIEPGYNSDRADEFALPINSDHVVPVPNTYLREIQTNGTYGPAYNMEEINLYGMNTRGIYRRDYTGIPHTGSGIYAVGQAVPRTCWLIQVKDECNMPVLGASIQVLGVNHGYRFDDISDQNGLACVEVGRSESNDQDFDGDGILNERFDVQIKLSRPLNSSSLRAPDTRTESTPMQSATCQQPDSCTPINLQFERCLSD